MSRPSAECGNCRRSLGYTHETEMTAITDTQELVTQSIVGYIETHVRKTVYLPLIVCDPAQ